MMQKVQAWSQPKPLLDLDEGAGTADEFGDEMGGGFARLHDVPGDGRGGVR